jgi:hypothetical protein
MVVLAGPAAQKLAGYPEDGDGYAGDFDNAQSYAAHLARIDAGLPMWPGPYVSLSEKSTRCEQNGSPG